MSEFGMARGEAVVDAREQFETQGVSLANIVTSGSLVVLVLVNRPGAGAGAGVWGCVGSTVDG